jgi:hypothetical protein
MEEKLKQCYMGPFKKNTNLPTFIFIFFLFLFFSLNSFIIIIIIIIIIISSISPGLHF